MLESGKPGREDRLHFVDYASEVVPQESNAGGPYTGSRALTRTAQAVEHVLALRPEDRPARVLVFTDGFSTEPLAGVAEKLARVEVPLDFRLLSAAKGDDFRLRRLQLPARAQVSEPFLVEVEVSGPQEGPVPLTIFRNGIWYILRSSDFQVQIVQFGLAGDFPVIGDYDADGKSDVAIFRNGVWYVINSSNGSISINNFGGAGDKPVAADYDNDGKTDLAIYRSGTWWILGSGNGAVSVVNFGLNSDLPIPGAYLP